MNWCPNCPGKQYLYLVAYPQPHTERGLLFARVCPECEYDDTLERFASRPEYSYTAWAYPGSSNGRIPHFDCDDLGSNPSPGTNASRDCAIGAAPVAQAVNTQSGDEE
jgi:hypothetical protein